MMKRTIAIITVLLIFVLSLSACKEEKVDPVATTEATVVTTEAETVIDPATCEHNFASQQIEDPSCTVSGLILYLCLECGYEYTEEIPAYGHDGSGASCTEAAICGNCGEVAEPPFGHSIVQGICQNCGVVLIPEETIAPIGEPEADPVVEPEPEPEITE